VRGIRGWLVIGVFLAWAVMLLMRVGYTPPASANDDVWFAEAAYWLLHDGVLRSDWHQDLLGSDVRAYYPPISSVVQAAVFRLMGISQFSMGIAPTAFVVLTMACMVLSLRQLRMSGPALLLGLAPFCVPDVFRHSLFLRYEFLVSLCLAVVFLLSLRLRLTLGRQGPLASLIGVFSALAGVSYYHVAPVCMPLGMALVLLAAPIGSRLKLIGWFVCGHALPWLAFAAWIGGDWRDFVNVMMQMAASYGPPETAGQMHFLTVIAILAFVLWARTSLKDKDFGMAVAWLVAAFIFMVLQLRHRGILPIAYLAAWCALMLALSRTLQDLTVRRAQVWTGVLAVPVALVALGLVFAACLKSQEDGRDYAPVKAAMLRGVNARGLVVTEAAGWLALREVIGRGKLIHYQIPRPNGGPASLNTSKVLLQADASPITTLVIRPALLDGAMTYSPALRTFLQSPDVAGPISVSEREPYRLVMYVRRNER